MTYALPLTPRQTRALDHTMTCPERGEPYLHCQQCKAIAGSPPPDDVRAEITAAIEDAKTAHAQRTAADRDRTERKNP